MIKVIVRRGTLPARVMFIAAVAALVLSGCATVDSGTIVDKFMEPGSTDLECKGTGIKKKCKIDTDPDACRFQLDNGKDRGWLDVDCATTYREYEVGEQYPR